MNKFFKIVIPVLIIICCVWYFWPKSCKYINEWDGATNTKICEFIKTAKSDSGRKIAVFDVDGTLMGQVPYYLADEAIFALIPQERWAEFADSRNVSKNGSQDNVIRMSFFGDKSADEIAAAGMTTFKRSFNDKIYPEMKALIKNLQKFGFEIYTISCSPQDFYRDVVANEFDIPAENVFGSTLKPDGTFHISCYEGKSEIIRDKIGAMPLLVGGNSSGDYAMMEMATGMRVVVNPSQKFADKFANDPLAVIVESNDVDDGREMLSREYKVKSNIEKQ